MINLFVFFCIWHTRDPTRQLENSEPREEDKKIKLALVSDTLSYIESNIFNRNTGRQEYGKNMTLILLFY